MNHYNLIVLHVLVLLSPLYAVVDFPLLQHIKPNASPDTQAKAAKDLIGRLVPERVRKFNIKVDASIGPENRDTFQLSSTSDGRINITGTSGVAVAMGFYHYFKYYCYGQRTWAGQQNFIPRYFPKITNPVTITTNDRFRYYQNVCTLSYTMAFWNWSRWEQEIDWMALHGINLPLAFVGQEAIFQRVYLSLGFTQADLDEHFGGPAFLAWARMGNIQGWGGPLPQSWISQQLTLQHQILDRMRSLGMISVLPAFAGHVPKAITRVYPQAKVSRLSLWGHFNSTYSGLYLLDFDDPLFNKIGAAVVNTIIAEFGTDHVYNTDTFNEMPPKSNDTAYINTAGKAVFAGLTSADPQAVWLMQGWLFNNQFWQAPQVKAYLQSVPQGRMIVLDLSANRDSLYKKYPNFFGQSYIWSMMENFGGTMEMSGEIDTINGVPATARAYPNSTMIGIGLTMEGIDQNEVLYEFMIENAWRPQPWDVNEWATAFAHQRYGTDIPAVASVWQLLMKTVYNATDNHADKNFVFFTSRPTPNQTMYLWYRLEDLFTAWDALLSAAVTLGQGQLYLYDLTDITRNSLQIISYQYYHNLINAFNKKDINTIKEAGDNITTILAEMDQLLASNENFLVGRWIADATSWATNANEAKLYEYNARNQITLWGPNGEIHDYASKQWSGVTADYYIPRWKFFTQWLVQLVENGTAWNEKIFNELIIQTVEAPWTFQTKSYPINPIGNTTSISKALREKYQPVSQNPFYDVLWEASTKQFFQDKNHFTSGGFSAEW